MTAKRLDVMVVLGEHGSGGQRWYISVLAFKVYMVAVVFLLNRHLTASSQGASAVRHSS